MKPETSTFFSFQKSQASHRSLLYMPLHWEQLGNVYVKFLAPKNLKGWPWPVGGWPHTLDWRDTRGPWGVWVNPGGLQLAATKLLWQISRREGEEAEAAWRTTKAKRPGAMQGNAHCTTHSVLSVWLFEYYDSWWENPFLKQSIELRRLSILLYWGSFYVTKRVLKIAAEAKGLKVLKHNLNFIHPLLSQVSQDPQAGDQ